MNQVIRWVLLVVAQLAFFLAAAHLVLGHHGLAAPSFFFDVPRGNLLAWVLMWSLPLAAWLALLRSRLAGPALVVLLLGILWLPVSILLAGNLNLNFAGGPRLAIWLGYSAVCLLGPVLMALGWLAASLWRGVAARGL